MERTIVKDRLLVSTAILPGILGFGLALLLIGDLVVAAVIGGCLSLVGAAISLSPPVQAARMRMLRRKYPKDT